MVNMTEESRRIRDDNSHNNNDNNYNNNNKVLKLSQVYLIENLTFKKEP